MATAPRLLDQVRERLRLKHYSIRTEQAYVDWIKRFILFHRKRHPTAMGEPEVRGVSDPRRGGEEHSRLYAKSSG